MTGPQITKGTQIIKEVTVSVFTWHDITYQCLKSSMKKLLALINDFSKASRYKNWVHYYKQWTLKRKFKQFYIYNSIKTNTTPQRWEIYTLKTITLMKEIKEDTINGKIFCAQPWPVGPVGALSHRWQVPSEGTYPCWRFNPWSGVYRRQLTDVSLSLSLPSSNQFKDIQCSLIGRININMSKLPIAIPMKYQIFYSSGINSPKTWNPKRFQSWKIHSWRHHFFWFQTITKQ